MEPLIADATTHNFHVLYFETCLTVSVILGNLPSNVVRRASRGDKPHLSGPQIEHQKIMNLTQIWDPKLDTKNHGLGPQLGPQQDTTKS